MSELERLYTKAEAAKYLGVSVKTLSNWISGRRITALTGRPVMIPESAIKEIVRKRLKRALI
ncbi:MAG: helix-turn-helix domain-containing protein [Deltaproteobacteria bacterium]